MKYETRSLVDTYSARAGYSEHHTGLAIDIDNNKLNITTSGDAVEYCVKSTRTTPESNNICWKKIENNTASISIYKYKKYYVWIKDTSGNISSPMSINTKDSD